MTRARPHHKPLVTRFAFVQPVRWIESKGPVPCERDEAQGFAVFYWVLNTIGPETGSWLRHAVYSGENMDVSYETARAQATALDADIARDLGVAR